MYRRVKSVIAGALVSIGLTSCLLTIPGYAQDEKAQQAQVTPGEKVETKGMILTRDGERMKVDTKDHGQLDVVINPETKIQVPKGIFRKKDMEATSLVPGLEIELKGTAGDNGQVTASSIQFTNESLKIAKQAHAAMTATNAQVAANQQGIQQNQQGIAANAAGVSENQQKIQATEKRFDDLTEFDVKKDIMINFETGKSVIPEASKQQLVDLAKEAQGIKGYLIEVKGFASTTGNAEQNQQLSEDRAEEVVTFLHQQGIDVRHVVNPGAMGTTNPVGDNETQMGQLQNQRVEVKLLVNRGLASK